MDVQTSRYHEVYARWQRDPEGFWEDAAQDIDWIEPPRRMFDPDAGIYVTTAVQPRAAWSAPHLVLPGKGLIDPCPLFDDDGTLWLVHAWAKSRAGFNNVLTLRRLTPDPLPSYLRLRQGGVAFGLDDDRDKLGAVLPLGGR